MLEIQLKLTNDGDVERNSHRERIAQSDDEILRVLSSFCKIQSALPCTEIIRLYEQIKSTSDCLIEYKIEDHPVLSPVAADTSYPTVGTCNSSSISQYHYFSFARVIVLTSLASLDPSLLTLEKDAHDHPARTTTSTLGSDLARSPSLPSPSRKTNKESSFELVEEASSALREQEGLSAKAAPGSDFDSAFRELKALQEFEETTLLAQSSNVHLDPDDPTYYPDSSSRSPVAGNDGTTSETVATSEAASPTGQLHAPSPSGPIEVEEMGEEPSPGLASNTVTGGSSKLCGMDTVTVEEHAHQASLGATLRDSRPQSAGTSSVSSSLSPGASLSTLDTSSPATPATTVSQQSSIENRTSKRCANERRSSRYQATVEDAPDEGESNAEELLDNSDEFGDLSIEAVLDDAYRFLGDTSRDKEIPYSGITNGVRANQINSASASDLPESNHGYALPSDAKGDTPQASPVSENQNTSRKRKLSSTAESQTALPAPNSRARSRNSVRQIQADSDLDNDRWDGRFSKYPILSTLSPDQKDEIERKCRVIIRSDLAEFIEKHTRIWKSTGFWCSPSLNPPKSPSAPASRKSRAIWRYVEGIQAEGETNYLKARFADIMLYLEYIQEFKLQRKAGHPGQTAKIRAINAICGTASLPKAKADKTRMSFHEHKLVGERWWWSGHYLGRGFIFLCSEETGKKIRSKSFKLDPFILYILHNCRGILACCSKFEEVADTLLTMTDGGFTKQISKKSVQQWIKDARAADHESVPTIRWQDWSTDAVARMASKFLSARASTQS